MDSDKIRVDPSHTAPRWAVAQTSATAITFAERALKIASTLCFVPRVHLRRSAGRLSWRRRLSRKGCRFLLKTCWIPSPDCISHSHICTIPTLRCSLLDVFRGVSRSGVDWAILYVSRRADLRKDSVVLSTSPNESAGTVLKS